MTHPCLSCGACCASVRVDFSVHETEDMGGIYEWRPSPCREFEAGGDACSRVRQRHQLPPLDGPTG